jgi:hypothetical protein
MIRVRVLIHLMLLAVVPLASATTLEHDAIFDSAVGRTCFRDLLQRSGWGLSGTSERAAFIIEQGDGSLSCQAWPSMHSYLSESFHGLIPEHAIGIVHTHPVLYPMPSLKDQEEATRIGIPIYVLTIRGVYKAVPGAREVSTLADKQSWIHELPATMVSGSATASR